MYTARKRRERTGPSRRQFAAACLALGAGSACAAIAPLGKMRLESTRFRSREELERVAESIREQFPDAVLLDAFAAPHVPELLVIHGARLQPDGVYEVRRYADGRTASNSPESLQLRHGSGCAQIFRHRSLSDRAAQWGVARLCPAPDEIGFYRVI